MWLIVGLGNPGADYAMTRHNIGFLALDCLAEVAGARAFSSKFQSDVSTGEFGGEKVVFLKPQTYMNLSGKAVQAAMAFYKIPPAKVIVLHDELDLPLGKLRIKKGGGANGHNGLKDIDQMIGQDYWRVRLGIGHPGMPEKVHGYVLGRFGSDEMPVLEKTLVALTDHFPLFWQHSPEALATKVAATLNPPPVKKKTETEAPATDRSANE